jgi:ribonuclease BN (tRNA processing enzyme)
LQITVLGKSPAWQDTGGACSGYLVRDNGFNLLLDCGSGVFSKLRTVCDYIELDAVLISHLHADHTLDLVPYSYALIYAPRQQPVPVAGWPGTRWPARPELHGPPGAAAVFQQMARGFGPDDLVDKAFQIREYEPADPLQIGPLRARFCEVPHFTRTFAVELTGTAGRRFTFSADCAPNDALVEFATDTDLLLIEATLPRPERTGVRGHLTPREAGEHARKARARKVVITHYSDELDADWLRAEAVAGFGAGELELAREGMELDV